MPHASIRSLIEEEKLPPEFGATVERCYLPLAHEIAARYRQRGGDTPLVIGVQGCQGSGKSTLARFLTKILQANCSLTSTALSIDDFYLTQSQRAELAQTVHPLLATRGVPGTHDTHLAARTIQTLKQLRPGTSCAIPRFNKATDDREPAEQWSRVDIAPQIIILEGWCVGLEAEPEASLIKPINRLEQDEDPQGIWRSWVNRALGGHYQSLFSLLDYLIVLQAPNFDCVYDWRLLQEKKLITSLAEKRVHAKAADKPIRTMTAKEIERFVAHYQRLTQHAFASLPAKADWILLLNSAHQITKMESRKPAATNRSTQ